MWFRGVNMICVLTREALFNSQLHGEFLRGLSEPGRPLCKDSTWRDSGQSTRWTRGCNQDQDIANLTYNHIWQPSSRAVNLGTTINSSIDNMLVGKQTHLLRFLNKYALGARRQEKTAWEDMMPLLMQFILTYATLPKLPKRRFAQNPQKTSLWEHAPVWIHVLFGVRGQAYSNTCVPHKLYSRFK